MWWIIGIGAAIFLIFLTYCLLKTASDADDREEEWWKDHENEFKKEDNNAN
jgi:hypothetical protein